MKIALQLVYGMLIGCCLIGVVGLLVDRMPERPLPTPANTRRIVDESVKLLDVIPEGTGCNQFGEMICCFDRAGDSYCCNYERGDACARLRLELMHAQTANR
jgi:hypothetical protein